MDKAERVALETDTYSVNADVIALSPAVSLGHNMLALSGSLSRAYVNAVTQDQLNAMVAMSAAVQSLDNLTSRAIRARTASEAMGLLGEVIADNHAN